MRVFACLPSQSFASQMPALPKGEPRSRSEFFSLTRSSTCLSLWERCRAATERAGSLVRELDLPQAKTEGICQIGKIRMRFALRCTCLHVCPLSHLLRKCQLSRRESQEGGANRTHASSGYLLRRLARVLLLPSRLAPCHLPQRGRLFLTRSPNLSLPLGEMSRSDREGRLPCEGAGLPLCGKTEGVCQIGRYA